MVGVKNNKTAGAGRKIPATGDIGHDDCTKTRVMSYAEQQ